MKTVKNILRFTIGLPILIGGTLVLGASIFLDLVLFGDHTVIDSLKDDIKLIWKVRR